MSKYLAIGSYGTALALAFALFAAASSAPAFATEEPVETPVEVAEGGEYGYVDPEAAHEAAEDATALFVIGTTAAAIGTAAEGAGFGLGTAGSAVGLPELP